MKEELKQIAKEFLYELDEENTRRYANRGQYRPATLEMFLKWLVWGKIE
jgi:hypothetical protein